MLEAIDGGLSAMGEAIVDDPEDALGRTVRLLAHDLLDQPAADIPGGQVLDRALAVVLALDLSGLPRAMIS